MDIRKNDDMDISRMLQNIAKSVQITSKLVPLTTECRYAMEVAHNITYVT